MKKADPRWNDIRVTKGSGNVFVDLGFDEAEARVMALRTELMLRIERHMKAKGWSQAEAARRMNITQPRVSKLARGAWREFSMDMLLTLASRAGMRPELRISR